MRLESPPLVSLLDNIFKCFEARLYLPAVSLALTVPDICSSLELAHDDPQRLRGAGERYKAWCARYLQRHYSTFDAADCWSLRCGVVHNAQSFGHRSRYDRVVLVAPWENCFHDAPMRGNGGSPEKILALDIEQFCRSMTAAAEAWFEEKAEGTIVRANLPDLIRLRPGGYPPHIGGVAVIA